MRSDVRGYGLSAPLNLQALLTQIASEPGHHALLAGGTELMVALNTGRLGQRSLLSIQHLRELRFIRVTTDAVHIGAATTFTDIRRNETIARELPMLVKAASWTGSIANQNRGTIGGNICNASPAADTPPSSSRNAKGPVGPRGGRGARPGTSYLTVTGPKNGTIKTTRESFLQPRNRGHLRPTVRHRESERERGRHEELRE